MEIKINTQHLNLREDQSDMVYRKFEKLTQLCDRLSDESSEIKVLLSYEQARQSDDAYKCEATIFVPQDTLRAESRQSTLENVIDDIVDKLKPQIEHYKAKIHHMMDRN